MCSRPEHFDDIPRLDAATFSRPAPRAAIAAPSGPLLLDGGLADLLTAAAVGDRVSPEAITAMVLRRWAHENERMPVIGDGRGGGTPYARKPRCGSLNRRQLALKQYVPRPRSRELVLSRPIIEIDGLSACLIAQQPPRDVDAVRLLPGVVVNSAEA